MFIKSLESGKGSHCFTVVSFFIQRSRNSQGGNGFPGSKAKDVEDWSSMGRVFFLPFLWGVWYRKESKNVFNKFRLLRREAHMQ